MQHNLQYYFPTHGKKVEAYYLQIYFKSTICLLREHGDNTTLWDWTESKDYILSRQKKYFVDDNQA